MKKIFDVVNIEFDKKFKNIHQIKKLNYRAIKGIGLWKITCTKNDDVSKLFDEVQNYMGTYLTSLEYKEVTNE